MGAEHNTMKYWHEACYRARTQRDESQARVAELEGEINAALRAIGPKFYRKELEGLRAVLTEGET